MELLDVLLNVYGLKSEGRDVDVITDCGYRAESVPEHCWSAIFLAKVLVPLIDPPVSLQRVGELLFYHDLSECITGDASFWDDEAHKRNKAQEPAAVQTLLGMLPVGLRSVYKSVSDEYVAQETRESRFARAVDKLDPAIEVLRGGCYSWAKHGLTASVILSKTRPYLEEFPPVLGLLEEVLAKAVSEGYILQ